MAAHGPNTQLVGVLPAAGHATRLGPLPFSKELFPIGWTAGHQQPGARLQPVCVGLLDRMRDAGVERVFIVLRAGKWDIPAYLGDGADIGLQLAYLLARLPCGAPCTVDQAYPFVYDATVVFGFPDVIFDPADAFSRQLAQLHAGAADVVLGLFPTDRPHTTDMVDHDAAGRVLRVEVKPTAGRQRLAWATAVWRPSFTGYLHRTLAAWLSQGASVPAALPPQGAEIFMGHLFQAAIEDGLHIDSVRFDDGAFLDIGTPETLARAIREADAKSSAG